MRQVNRGFSLIEMLVAMTIMSMSVAALYQATAGATRNVRVDEKYSYAYLLAESLLAEYAVVDIAGMSQQGETAGGFQWRVSTTPVEGELPKALKEGSLQTIQVTVNWGEARQVQLDSVVAGQELE